MKLEEEWRIIIKDAIQREEIAGASVLLTKNGKEICKITDGYADREKKIKIAEHTIFRLYSMTKPITAVAAMILAESGALELTAPVSDYLPVFKNSKVWNHNGEQIPNRPILVKDLLSMTSGLTYGDRTRALLNDAEESLFTDKPMTTYEFAERVGTIPLLFHPGTSWKYGISADILGAVIEEVSGKKFGEFLEEKIFTPLGMKDTGFYVPAEKQPRLAVAYEKNKDNKLVPYLGNFLGVRNSMNQKATYESGGAGLVSTIEDYSKFARMLLGEGRIHEVKLLEPESVKKMKSGGLGKEQHDAFNQWFWQKGYDYGWLMRVLKDISLDEFPGLMGEYGWDGWLGCCFVNYPDANMTFLVMQQQKDGGNLVCNLKEAMIRHKNKSALSNKKTEEEKKDVL